MAVTCVNDTVPDILFATLLAVILFPGFIFSFPAVPAARVECANVAGQPSQNPTLARRIFFTGQVTLWSVIVHMLIFALLFTTYSLIAAYVKGTCFQ